MMQQSSPGLGSYGGYWSERSSSAGFALPDEAIVFEKMIPDASQLVARLFVGHIYCIQNRSISTMGCSTV